MAELRTTPTDVVVHLSPAERLWSLRGDVRVPRAAVAGATVVDDGPAAVRGLRAPGLAVPGRRVGTWRGRWGKDLVAVRSGRPTVVVDLGGAPWRRLLVSYEDRQRAERAVTGLTA